jgi:hypothetical protein
MKDKSQGIHRNDMKIDSSIIVVETSLITDLNDLGGI